MLSSRGVRIGLRALHNGKGRPRPGATGPRSYSQLLGNGKPGVWLPSKPHIQSPQLPLASTLLHSYRFASTSSASTAASTVAMPPAPDAATSGSEWEALIREASEKHALQVEEHIGWLKELGLDYGWGPTAIMEFALEHMHLYTGFPWWASILATSLLVRTLLIRLFVTSADQSARMATLQPTLAPLQEKMREGRQSNDQQAITDATQELRMSYRAANIKFSRLLLPILLQGSLGFGMFRLTRGMTYLPVPGLESGGVLWFKDLTIADPTCALPILSGIIMWYALKRGGEMGTTSVNAQTWKLMTYLIPSLGTLVFLFQPAGMSFLACITAAWSFIQGAILRSPRVRQWLNIMPLPPPRAQSGADQRYKGTATAYRTPDEIAKSNTVGQKFRDARSTVSDYVKSNTPQKKTRLSARDLEKAQQYEKERRAEIDAARDRYLKGKGPGKKK